MKNAIIFILVLVYGTVYSQTGCERFGVKYTPKSLNKAITYLNCNWTDKDKTEFKVKSERDAVAELHFGTGLSLRNG